MRMWCCEDRTAPFVEVFRRTAIGAGYDLQFIAPNASEPKGFSQLKRHYHHLSPNPERFELASFRRWYEIAAKVAAHERFVIADSDLVIFTEWRGLPYPVREHEGLVGSIGVTDNVLENGINGGFSVWTGRLLLDFCEYLTETYQSRSDELVQLHASKIAAGNLRASISDMTLLYRWVHDERVSFFNTNRLIRDSQGRSHYIDHNFFMPEALDTHFIMSWGRKKIYWHGSQAMLGTLNEELVTADSLHLGGRYKILATDLMGKNKWGLMSKSMYIRGGRAGRAILTKMGIY